MESTSELTLSQAAKQTPGRDGKPVHINTIRRWVAKGFRGVRLSAWRRGGMWFTSASALEQFKVDCTRVANASVVRTPDVVAQEVAEARAELQRLGFYGRNKKKD